MTPEGIAAKVAYGYGKSGSKLGPVHTLYRPTSPLTPALAPQNVMTPQLQFIASATPDVKFTRPAHYNEPLRFGLYDTTQTQVGDYIDGPTGTFFVISQRPIEAPELVFCDVVISVTRAAGDAGAGVQPYGGRVTATDVLLVNQWPASMVLGGRAQSGQADLPGDVRDKGVQALLPATMGVILRTSDRVTDSQGRAFTISSAELSDLGWRLDLILSVT